MIEKTIRKAVRYYIIKENKVVVIKYKEPNRRVGFYDIPGGKIEEGETPDQTAIREVKEETGMDIKDLERKGNLIVEYPERIFDFEVFIAKDFEGTPKELEENYSMWIDIDELLNKENIFSCIQILNSKYRNVLEKENANFKMHILVDEYENILNINFEE